MQLTNLAARRPNPFASIPAAASRTEITDHLLGWEFNAGDDQPASHFVTREIGDARLVDCHMSPSIGHRRPAHIAQDTNSYFCMVFHRSGDEVWRTQSREMHIQQGCLAVWHSARPSSFRVMQPLHKLVILLPAARVEGYLPDPETHAGMIVDNSTGIGAILNNHVGSIHDHFGCMSEREIATALSTALELFGAHVESTQNKASTLPRTSLIERITAYIERRLDDPDLTPMVIARAQGISLRYLHLLFSQRGETVGGWIRRRRLIQSGSDLKCLNGRHSVTEIAFRWGFKDAAHFSRAFKKQFGVSPRDYRG